MGAHQSRHRLLRQTLGAGLAWDAHELLEGCDDFRSQRADRRRNRLLDAVWSCAIRLTSLNAGRAAPRCSGSGVTDIATRSRRMPSPAYVSHNSRNCAYAARRPACSRPKSAIRPRRGSSGGGRSAAAAMAASSSGDASAISDRVFRLCSTMSSRKLIADQIDAHVVVVQCAEYLLDRFHALDLPLTSFPELRSKQLEGVAKPLGGDPQVMQCLGEFRMRDDRLEGIELGDSYCQDAARVVDDRRIWDRRRRPAKPGSRCASLRRA